MENFKPDISFFSPAFNEAENIALLIQRAEAALKPIANRYEIIIVDDGSMDQTAKIAEAFSKKDDHIRVVRHPRNYGYGAALQTGFREARYEYIFFTDADLQFDAREIKNLVEFIPDYEVVLGYRLKRQDSLLRLIYAWVWNTLNRIIFRLKVKDIDCAFKLIKREAISGISLKSKGAMASAELLVKLSRQGVKFKEIPVSHFPRARGQETGGSARVIFRALRELVQLYRGELGDVSQKQILKFIVVGVFNTFIDLISYFFITRTLPFFETHKVTAKTVSFGLGTITSFIVNRKWTFQKKDRVRFREIFRFYVTVGSALMVNALVMYLFVHVLFIHDLLGVIIATGLSFVWNFTLSKFWVFPANSNSDRID